MARVLVLDNGADSARFGFAGSDSPTVVVPNCTATPRKDPRKLIADETESGIKDHSQLAYTRPFERGYLTNPACEVEVWERAVQKLAIDPAKDVRALVMTEPLFTPAALQSRLDEVVFEQFGFQACYRTPAAPLSALDYKLSNPDSRFASDGCCVVVDSGFSFSHAVPIFDNHVLNYAARRVDVGGKLLTNYLKELLSYRQLNVMDDTYMIDRAKRELCFVSTDFGSQLAEAERRGKANTLWRDFALPNFTDTMHGRVLERADLAAAAAAAGDQAPAAAAPAAAASKPSQQEQRLRFNNERFAVPEVLFSPRGIGLEQGGVHEATAQAIAACAPEMQRPLYLNILLTGGNTLFANFKERFTQEIQPLAPAGVRPSDAPSPPSVVARSPPTPSSRGGVSDPLSRAHACSSAQANVHVVVPSDPLLSAWRGGSRLGASEELQEVLVTKAQYEEHGHEICRRGFEMGFGSVPLKRV